MTQSRVTSLLGAGCVGLGCSVWLRGSLVLATLACLWPSTRSNKQRATLADLHSSSITVPHDVRIMVSVSRSIDVLVRRQLFLFKSALSSLLTLDILLTVSLVLSQFNCV